MLVFRRFIGVGAGVFVVLGYGASAAAQSPALISSHSHQSPTKKPLPVAAALNLPAKSAESSAQGSEVLGERDYLQDDLDAWRKAEPLVSQIKQMENQEQDAVPERTPSPLPESPSDSVPERQSPSPLPESPSENFDLAPERPDTANPPNPQLLDPSDNPLRFPTRPNEVEVETLQPITLEQAIALALRNNRDLQTTRLALERSREFLREALAAQFPTLDLTLSVTRTDSATSGLSDGASFGGIPDGTTAPGVDAGTTPDGAAAPGVDAGTTPDGTAAPGVDAGTTPDGAAPTLETTTPATDAPETAPLSQEVEDGAAAGDGAAGDGVDAGAGGGTFPGFEFDDSSISDFLSGTLRLEYDIFTGGFRPASIRAAERTVRLSELEVEEIVEDTRLTVVNDYYDLQDADAQVNIERAAVEDATQTLRDAQLLEQAGLGTRFEVLQAEVELANANQNLILAIATQRIESRQLAETLSIGPNVDLTAADEIEEAGVWNLSLEESIVLAFQNRAELQQFLLEREINLQEREIALAAIRPQLSVFATYDVAEDLDDADSGFEDGYSVGATLSWRLFDGGAARASADQEETDTDIDEVEFANERDEVRLEVEDAFFSLEANQENIRTAEQAVTLAEESLRLARLRFQAGVGTQTDVIDQQAALTDARGDFLTAVIEYNRSLNELQRAVSNLPESRLFDLP